MLDFSFGRHCSVPSLATCLAEMDLDTFLWRERGALQTFDQL